MSCFSSDRQALLEAAGAGIRRSPLWQAASRKTVLGAPLTTICCCRELGHKVSTVRASDVRPLGWRDLEQALGMIRPSVSRQQLAAYETWTQEYGTM